MEKLYIAPSPEGEWQQGAYDLLRDKEEINVRFEIEIFVLYDL